MAIKNGCSMHLSSVTFYYLELNLLLKNLTGMWASKHNNSDPIEGDQPWLPDNNVPNKPIS
jgi:hypothetical protein